MKRHLVRVHDDEHPYLCGDCPKGFPSVDDLAKHNQESHFGIVTKGPYCAWYVLNFCLVNVKKLYLSCFFFMLSVCSTNLLVKNTKQIKF